MNRAEYVLQEETQFRAGIRIVVDGAGKPWLEHKHHGGDWIEPKMADASALHGYFYDVTLAAFEAGRRS